MTQFQGFNQAQIDLLVKQGKLPNTMRWKHFTEISACNEEIGALLDRLNEQGFDPLEIHWAYCYHLYLNRFGLEDCDLDEAMQLVEKEVFEVAFEHRKKYPKKFMQSPEGRKMAKQLSEKYDRNNISR